MRASLSGGCGRRSRRGIASTDLRRPHLPCPNAIQKQPSPFLWIGQSSSNKKILVLPLTTWKTSRTRSARTPRGSAWSRSLCKTGSSAIRMRSFPQKVRATIGNEINTGSSEDEGALTFGVTIAVITCAGSLYLSYRRDTVLRGTRRHGKSENNLRRKQF
jgi:hypothetical protein